jgi:hypothetical protein
MADDGLKRRLSAELLGPVLYAFCHRLWLYHLCCNKRPAKALFLARGGLRLLTLYQRFLIGQDLSAPLPCGALMVSRLTATKAGLRMAPALAMRGLLREHRDSTVAEAVASLLSDTATDPESVETALPGVWRARCSELTLYQFLNSDHPRANALQQHLSEQSTLLSEHLEDVAGGASHLLLCDTGLFASTQAMLMACFPKFVWTGTYFGRANYRREPAPHHADAFGLIVDRDRASVWVPETAFLRYWHLCEMPLEPNLPTVTTYHRDPISGQVKSNLEQPGWEEAIAAADNPFYAGILDYFDTLPAQPADRINAAYRSAVRELRRRVWLPTRDDVAAMTVGDRSPDFGRVASVPVIRPPEPRQSLKRKVRAVRKSLWAEGQMRVSFARAGGLLNLVWFSARTMSETLRWLRHSVISALR